MCNLFSAVNSVLGLLSIWLWVMLPLETYWQLIMIFLPLSIPLGLQKKKVKQHLAW
jgi:hypothetical protein